MDPEAYHEESFVYDLPIGRRGGLFRCDLDELMERQLVSHPQLEIPVLISKLLEAIREADGTTSEGIFRISPGAKQVLLLKAQLENGDWTIPTDSPHVAAALLKEVLRGFSQPLVPFDKYELCLKMADDTVIDDDEWLWVIQEIPLVNQCVLEALADLFEEMLRPHNQECTKMTSHNLAVVFAPAVLRQADATAEEMLANSRAEVEFTKKFIEYLVKQHLLRHGQATEPAPHNG